MNKALTTIFAFVLGVAVVFTLAGNHGIRGGAQETVSYTPKMTQPVGTTSFGTTVAVSYAGGVGNGTYGGNTGSTRTFVACGHAQRIRQDGTISAVTIKLPVGADTNLSTFKLRVFRWDGSAWDQVGSDSDDISGSIVANSTTTYTLGTPITGVRAGDCLGVAIALSGANGSVISATTSGLDANDNYETQYDDSDVTGANQTFGVINDDYSLMLTAHMTSPIVAVIGDNIAAGHTTSSSLLQLITSGTWESKTVTQTIPAYLYDRDSTLFLCRHHGYGATTADDWASASGDYVTTYCTAFAPKAAVILLGLNDIAAGTTYANYIADIADIVQSLRAVGVIPVMCTITPYHGGTAAQKATVKEWNRNLRIWCAERQVCLVETNRVVADPSDTDIIVSANPDLWTAGVHPSAAGYKAMAAAIAAAIYAAR